jgi:hypothetical protein
VARIQWARRSARRDKAVATRPAARILGPLHGPVCETRVWQIHRRRAAARRHVNVHHGDIYDTLRMRSRVGNTRSSRHRRVDSSLPVPIIPSRVENPKSAADIRGSCALPIRGLTRRFQLQRFRRNE